jgi:Uma2 family endonuclease
VRPLVPDISFVRNERLRGLTREEAQIPLFAPDIAFEILSPSNRRPDIDDKIDVLLRAGTELVVVIDPIRRIAELHDGAGKCVLSEDTLLAHAALPGFSYVLRELFAELELPT